LARSPSQEADTAREQQQQKEQELLKKMATLQAMIQSQKQQELAQQHQQAHQIVQHIQRQLQAVHKPPPPQPPAAAADQRFQSPPRFLEHTQGPPVPEASRATTPSPQPTLDVPKANGVKPADLDEGDVRTLRYAQGLVRCLGWDLTF